MTQPTPDPAPTPPPAAAEPDRGFPEGTPRQDMTDAEQINYWKHYARRNEETVRARADYDELKAKAAKLEKLERQSLSEHEKAVAETREAALAEGRQAAMTELGTKYTRAFLAEALTTRGRTQEQVDVVLRHTNLETYVTDGEPDTDAIAAYADTIAGPIGNPPPPARPDHGQGPRGAQTRASGLDAGKAMFEARHGKQPATQ